MIRQQFSSGGWIFGKNTAKSESYNMLGVSHNMVINLFIIYELGICVCFWEIA